MRGMRFSALLDASGIKPTDAMLLRHPARPADKADGPRTWRQGRAAFGHYISYQGEKARFSPYSRGRAYAFHFLRSIDVWDGVGGKPASDDATFVGASLSSPDRWHASTGRRPRLFHPLGHVDTHQDNECTDHWWQDRFDVWQGRLRIRWTGGPRRLGRKPENSDFDVLTADPALPPG